MSTFITTLIMIPLICISSFLFCQVGIGLGLKLPLSTSVSMMNHNDETSQSTKTSRLRSNLDNNNNNNRPTITSLISDFDLKQSNQFIHELKVPKCARDVFLTLHKEIGGDDEHDCRGLLVRDDIIITSKECSKFDVTFDFPGGGIVQAVPHSSLNLHYDMVDSPLGFLKVHPPAYYLFIDQPVRRKRMFLSRRSDPTSEDNGIGYREAEAVFMTCGDNKHKPIAHNFPINGNILVPLKHLAAILPDDILWEDTDLKTARTLKYKSTLWYTRPITLKAEQETFTQMFSQWQGPPGSLSLPDAPDEFERKVAAVSEAVDPRGHRYRRQFCFKNYFVRYQDEEPFSGLHFFDWLDFGPGTFLLEENEKHKMFDEMSGDDSCVKKWFNHPKFWVPYFTDEQRSEHEVSIAPSRDGKRLIMRYKHNDEYVPKSAADEPHLYAWDLHEKFYVVDDMYDREKYGADEIKHSSIVAGRPVLAAGEVHVGHDGVIWGINFNSGHYYPDIHSISIMYQWMKNQGFDTSALHWIAREEFFEYKGGQDDTSPESRIAECNNFDWDSVKLPGYDSKQLHRVCTEVTVSPSWKFCGEVAKRRKRL